VKVTAIQTAIANLHHLHEEAPLQWNPLRRKLGIILDSKWAGPVPIYSYLIKHPEGLFVVYTGDNSPADRYERNVDGPVSTGPGGRSSLPRFSASLPSGS
jgi:hypothetical protein